MKIIKYFLITLTIGCCSVVHWGLPKLIIDTKITQIASIYKPVLPNNATSVYFTTKDSLSISGIFSSALDSTKGTIILLHGIRGYKEHFAPLSQMLNNWGYSTLAIDLRAHGNSDGPYCTYGYYEKNDIQSAVDFLLREHPADSNIGVWGQSLGGAIAIQALSVEPRLKFGIVESTFSDFSKIVHDYTERTIGFRFSILSKYLINRAASIADFDPTMIVPSHAAKQVTQPVLMAHGDKDQRIKIAYGQEIFDKLPSKKKQFLTIENASHVNLWQIGGEEYFQQVKKFLHSLSK